MQGRDVIEAVESLVKENESLHLKIMKLTETLKRLENGYQINPFDALGIAYSAFYKIMKSTIDESEKKIDKEFLSHAKQVIDAEAAQVLYILGSKGIICVADFARECAKNEVTALMGDEEDSKNKFRRRIERDGDALSYFGLAEECEDHKKEKSYRLTEKGKVKYEKMREEATNI